MIKKFNTYIRQIPNHPKAKQLVDWSKKYPLPGSSGIPLFDIGKFIYEETKKDNLTTRSNSIAFSLFLAIFPFVIFLFTLLPYLPFTRDYAATISISSEKILPSSAHSYLMKIIEDLTKIKRGGLLSIGFLLALYFSSNGMISLMRGFDKTYKASFRNRSIFYKRGVALILTFLLGLLFIFSITLIIFSDIIFNWLAGHINNSNVSNMVFLIAKGIFTLGILYVGIWLIYHYGPSLRKKLPFINPGTIVASLLSLTSSVIFAHFVNNFGKFNEIYGSIGALIVILLWIKINAFILLVGFELNAAIAVNRDIKNLENQN